MAKDIIIWNAGINSGNPVELNAKTFTYAWKNLTRAKPIPGGYDFTEAGLGGWENPKINVTGIIDADAGTSVNSATGNKIMTLNYLIDFASRRTGETYIKAYFGNTTTQITFPGTTAISSTSDNTFGSAIAVQIDTFDIPVNTQIKNGQKINYNLTFTQTK